MAVEVFLVRNEDFAGFLPAYNSDDDKIKTLKKGEIYQCKISQSRNLKFLRKFMALIKLVFENQEVYTDFDRLRKDLIIEAGYYTAWIDFNGIIQKEALSISFGSMDEDVFSKLYSDVVNVIIEKLKVTKKQIAEEVEQYF